MNAVGTPVGAVPVIAYPAQFEETEGDCPARSGAKVGPAGSTDAAAAGVNASAKPRQSSGTAMLPRSRVCSPSVNTVTTEKQMCLRSG